MAETIQTVTDTSKFSDLFSKYYAGNEAFARSKSGDIHIQFLGYKDGNAAFRFPRVKSVPDVITVFTRSGDHTIYTNLKFIEKDEDTFIFMPIKFQIITERRREERTSLDQGEGKVVLFVGNVISESMMESFLESGEKRIRLLKERIAADLKGKFNQVKTVFVNEARIDVRMKRFLEKPVPIFIPDRTASPPAELADAYRFYLSEIYPKDYRLSSRKEIVSEIAVPFIYRNIIPFGYLQVNNASPMNETHLRAVKRYAAMIADSFVKNGIFTPGEDRFVVSDISKQGLGIVFRDRRLMKYFVKGGRLILEMELPDKSKVIMGAVVRNTIFHENGIIKVGLEIAAIDALSEANYDELLHRLAK